MSTLSDITKLDEKALEKIQLEAHFHCDPNQKENLLFLSPLLLLEDYDLKEGGYKDYGAKTILGRVTKDILERDSDVLLQVPEVTFLRMGYGKNSENKKGKMAITEEEAKVWKSFIDHSRFAQAPNTDAESAASGDREEETPMEIDFPTPADTQAHECTHEDTIEMVPPDKSGLKIPLQGRYILLFSILLIFYDKKKLKEREEGSNEEKAKIGANKISDFMLFWILPYLLSFNSRKVQEIIQHHKAKRVEFNDFVELSTLDIINESFASCEVSAEIKEKIVQKYKDYYGTEQLRRKYKLLKAVDESPLILVPKRYIIKQMPAELDDIGQNWRELGNVTLLDEFRNKFIRSREIQEDFLHSLKDLKHRQGIDYAILLPDVETFEEVIRNLEEESAEYLSRPKLLERRGRSFISPRIGLVKNTEKDLTVCISFFQGSDSHRVSGLFRATGAHYLDHFTLVILHGLCLNPRDPQCRVGSLYPVACARKMLFKGNFIDKKKKKKKKKKNEDFSEAQGKFSKAEFPETYAMWEEAVQSDPTVQKVINKSQRNLKIKPTFERSTDLTVWYSTSSNARKLQCTLSGAAWTRNEEKLEGFKVRAVNLNGCLLSKLAKCGREGNTAVVLAVKDNNEEPGSCLPNLPGAIKMIISHFVRAVVVAGLPEVYSPEPDLENRDVIECSTSSDEDDGEGTDTQTVAATSSGRAPANSDAGSSSEPPIGRHIKDGTPSDEELERLAPYVITIWKTLGHLLRVPDTKLNEIDIDYKGCREKAVQMLFDWRERCHLQATYEVLFNALCDPAVGLRNVASEHCCA